MEEPTLAAASSSDKSQLWAWNKTQLPETVDDCVHVLFEQQAAKWPEAVAVDAWDGAFTYAQLDSIANLIAHYLVENGVGPGSMVPLCFEKSCWAVAALMGVLKAGGALVFVDPANPQSRREEILSQINAGFVLTSAGQADPWELMGVKTILVNQQLIDSLPKTTTCPPQTETTPEHLVYVIFTSGSTGKPKGCLIQHKAFLSGAVQHSAKGNLTCTSRVMQLASYSFDVSMLEILTSLISGATVCTPGDEAMVKGLAWAINTYRINWTFLTPSMVKLVKPEEVPNLKTLSLGGEPLHQIDIETWAPCLQLINGYGPTECSVAAAGEPRVRPGGDPANIGRAVGGLCWIVNADDHDELIPIGAVGELLISGPILARGYLDDPVKTSESFIVNPAWSAEWLQSIEAAPDTPMRLYKTGDLAKFNRDGTIHFMGRKDHQVKLHGLRIELGEIEHNIAQHGHIKHVAVFLPKTGPCREKLVAVVSLHGLATESQPGQTDQPLCLIDDASARDQVAEVRQHLHEKVPEYMVPTVWITIEAWPLLISAKLNRKLVTKWLVSMDDSFYEQLMHLDKQEPDVSGMSELEITLRQIYCQTLNLSLDQVLIDRPFLSMGGDSLGALRVLGHCRKVGINLTIEDVLRSSGIRDLAVRADGKGLEGQQDSSSPIGVSTVQSVLLGSEHHSQVVSIQLDRSVTPEQFRAALDAVVSRHSMLRAQFSHETGHWAQTTLPKTDQPFRFKSHTVGDLDKAYSISESARSAVEPQGPVFSADLVIVGTQQFVYLAAHPAVVDPTSWTIILRDLEAHLSTGSLPRDLSSHFHQWVKQELSNGSTKDAFTDSVSMPETGARETAVENTLTLSQAETALLRGHEVHKCLRTEPQDLILAAIFYAFSQDFPQRSLPITHTIGRSRASDDRELDFSTTVGCFERLEEVAVKVPIGCSVVDLVKRVKDARRRVQENDAECLLASQDKQDIVLDNAEFEIFFDYLASAIDETGPKLQVLSNTTFATHRNLRKGSRRDSMIDVTTALTEAGMQISFAYSACLQNQERIQAWIRSIKDSINSLMYQLLHSPSQFSLAEFPLLPLTYDGLDRLAKDSLPAIAADPGMVEDVYPCSPMQQGLLLSQSRPDISAYQHFNIAEVKPRKPARTVDATQLAHAWKQVVQRHPSLRTVFVESSAQLGFFDQVVLKHVEINIIVVECRSDLEADDVFRKQESLSFTSGRLPHRLTICHVSADRLLIKLDINHAIIDGSSIANIVRDLALAYETRLPVNPAFNFSRYIKYTRSLPDETALDFWKGYLDGLQPCIFPRLAMYEEPWHDTVVEDARIDFSFSPEALSKFCQDANVSAANVFQTAWALVLRVYTESEDVCFGMLSSGRDVPLPGIEDGVGAFLTMLVCRSILGEDMSVSQVLSRAAADLVESLPHQHCGLANVHHAVKAASSPLFNTIITFNNDKEALDLEESSISIKNISISDPTEYALTLDIWFSKNGVRATLRHSTDYLTPNQAQNIASAFDKAIVSILSEPDMTIRDVDLVSKYHMDKLVEFNGPVRQRSDRLMFTHFEEQAMIRPDAPAVHAWDGLWTYKELDDMTNRLAHYLHTLGVGPEVIVPHCFPKSCWAVITMMSIVKAGGAFVGLDFSHPVQRLEGLVSAVDASVVCTSAENAHLFKRVRHLVIVNAQLLQNLPDKPSRPCPEVKPNNTACVVFTSGTTGVPKAIVIEHASMASNSDLMGPVLKLDTGSRVFQFASYTFDVSNQDTFTTLQHGGCVCVPSEDDRVNDPGAAIECLGANWANLTSTVMSLIHPARVPSLKRIFQLGEPLAHEAKDLWVDRVELYNTYGPAEAAVTVTCTDRLTVKSNTANVGRVPGCWAWAVNATNFNKLVPLGAVGELVLEGPLLARLYLKNPEKTADAFVMNPEWAQKMTPGQDRRFYRTGDLCRFNSNGTLSILGRRDTQIKINGQRVELDEITHQIQRQLGGRTLVSVDAVPIPKVSRGKTLVAFIQFLDSQREETDSDDGSTSIDGLRLADMGGKLRDCLPQYMVPSLFLPIKETPKTANGKLDRFKLREIASSLSDDQLSSYMQVTEEKKAPTTEDELFLQALWSKVLNISPETISSHDDFFRLGGDSVAAMSLVSAARAEGVSIAVADMFASPLLLDMALTMRRSRQPEKDEPFNLLRISDESSIQSVVEEAASQCGVPSQAVVDLYPCSPLQEALMALSVRQQGAYKAQRAFRITDEYFDLARFKQAWDAVARSEAILRTRIVNTRAVERPLQAVLETEVEWIERDKLEAYLEEDRDTPITYGGMLWRPALVTENTSRYFVWSAHHAMYDAWSAGILFDQISRLYKAGGSLTTSSAPFKGMIRYLESVQPGDAKAFWLSQFPETMEEPVSFPAMQAEAQQTARPDQTVYLETQVSRCAGISVATVLRAAWALVISHYTNSDDVVFAETLSGRNAPVPGIPEMSGPAITTVPLRIRMDKAGGTTVVVSRRDAECT